MKVDIDYIFWLYNELRKIEEVPLSELEFYIENQKIEMDEEQIKRWAFTGLMNKDFLTSGQYKESSGYKQMVRENKIKEFLNEETSD